MGFVEAVKTCLIKKYTTFSGRASRSEYWYFGLFVFGVYFVNCLLFIFVILSDTITMIDFGSISRAMKNVSLLITLAVILPSYSVLVRRLHDRNISGWWAGILFGATIISLLMDFIEIYDPLSYISWENWKSYLLGLQLILSIVFVVITVMRGTNGPNRYDADPLR
ncbi:MAG: Hypothetical protein BHV28_08320 [Candidatus Tokpelaia hoelldobleri]|uniref:DUF805 domain-containing protein n=1 Tax=Candidatus Tokpelaia hoelldobleri TaxID=1902579 RepID=A0A1U9JUK0_9HYPH|nr:MAG: Hypothetical protein BHV28_08320 [Candidatus Tokpelaia hoelldoblerii]